MLEMPRLDKFDRNLVRVGINSSAAGESIIAMDLVVLLPLSGIPE